MAAGLAAFAIWHLLEAPRRRLATLQRLGHLAAVAGCAALAWSAASLLLRLADPDGALRRSALEWMLSSRAGRLALESSGWLTAAAGLYEIWQGASGRLANRFSTRWLPRDAARLLKAVARFGIASRGVVLALLGVFQVRVARELDPRELSEIGGAFKALSRSPAGGPALAALIALGLIAYGFYMGVFAVAARRG
ncbi:MAG: DUF1206 domain-containing protein [Thermoanaerobaculia bacterium]